MRQKVDGFISNSSDTGFFISRENNYKILYIILMRFYNILFLFSFFHLFTATKIEINNSGGSLHLQLTHSHQQSELTKNIQISQKLLLNKQVQQNGSKSYDQDVEIKNILADAGGDGQKNQSNFQQKLRHTQDTKIIEEEKKQIIQQSTLKIQNPINQYYIQTGTMRMTRLLQEQLDTNKISQELTKQPINKEQQLKDLQKNIRLYLQMTSVIATESNLPDNTGIKQELIPLTKGNESQSDIKNNSRPQTTQAEKQEPVKKQEKIDEQVKLTSHIEQKNAGSGQQSQVQVQMLTSSINKTKKLKKLFKPSKISNLISINQSSKNGQKQQIKQTAPAPSITTTSTTTTSTTTPSSTTPEATTTPLTTTSTTTTSTTTPETTTTPLTTTSTTTTTIAPSSTTTAETTETREKTETSVGKQLHKEEEIKIRTIQEEDKILGSKIQSLTVKMLEKKDEKQKKKDGEIGKLKQEKQFLKLQQKIPEQTNQNQQQQTDKAEVKKQANKSSVNINQQKKQNEISNQSSQIIEESFETAPVPAKPLNIKEQVDFIQLQRAIEQKQREIDEKERQLQKHKKQLAEFKALINQNKGQKSSIVNLNKLLKSKINLRKNFTTPAIIIIPNESILTRNQSTTNQATIQKLNISQPVKKEQKIKPQKPSQLKIQQPSEKIIENKTKIINEAKQTKINITANMTVMNQTTQRVLNQTKLSAGKTIQQSQKFGLSFNDTKNTTSFKQTILLNISASTQKQPENIVLDLKNQTMQQKFRKVMKKYWEITNNLNQDYLFGFNIVYALECLVKNHRYDKVGKVGFYRCIKVYKDGQKPCFSSHYFEGDCIIRNHSDSRGACQPDDNPFGCWNTIQYYEFTGRIICME